MNIHNFPEKKYKIIYADPPWQYRDKRTNPGPKGNYCGSAERHYPTMRLSDICNLPVNNIAADCSILFLWTTYPQLFSAEKVINAWGFNYKTIGFNWIKTTKSGKFAIGPGSYTRANAEPCLLAVRGKAASELIVDHSIVNVIQARRRKHSEKPHEVRNLIERLTGYPDSKIELFARNHYPGWDAWGDEIQNSFSTLPV